MRVLDAGFGQGRNLVYLLRQGLDVSGVDGRRSDRRRQSPRPDDAQHERPWRQARGSDQDQRRNGKRSMTWVMRRP